MYLSFLRHVHTNRKKSAHKFLLKKQLKTENAHPDKELKKEQHLTDGLWDLGSGKGVWTGYDRYYNVHSYSFNHSSLNEIFLFNFCF